MSIFLWLCLVLQIGMDAAKEQSLRATLVPVEDKTVQRRLDDPSLMLYTFEEVPKAYQNFSNVSSGIHSPLYNISGGADFGGVGNAAKEFPWNTPFGTQGVSNFRKFRGVWLPKKKDGTPWPIVTWKDRLITASFMADRPTQHYRFLHPVGTMYFEFLTTRDSQGRDWLFEIRVREREIDEWAVDVFRPVPDVWYLLKRIKEQDGWQRDPLLSKAVRVLEANPSYENRRMVDSRNHRNAVIDVSGRLEFVPALPEDFVIKLLTDHPWESVLGCVWRNGDVAAKDIHAASTKAAFSFVPRNYQAGLVAVDRESCARCHDSTNKHVSLFGPMGRDWYGNTPGFDGQFTFHGWDRQCVSPNGTNRAVRWDIRMEKAGIFTRYDSAVHPSKMYAVIRGVE